MDFNFIYNVGFWIKFTILFVLLVIAPIFFMDITGSLGFGRKIMFMLAGALGVIIALNGKAIGRKKQ